MVIVAEQIPGKAGGVVPLPGLADLAPHEQQLLARVPIHVSQERAGVGEALPLISRHFRNQRPF